MSKEDLDYLKEKFEEAEENKFKLCVYMRKLLELLETDKKCMTEILKQHILTNLVTNYDYDSNIIEERAIGDIYDKLETLLPVIVTERVLDFVIKEELYYDINYEMYKSRWCEGYPIVTDIFIETISAMVDLVIQDIKSLDDFPQATKR